MRFLSILTLCLFLTSNPAPAERSQAKSWGWMCQETVTAMRALTVKLDEPLRIFKPDEVRQGMVFDPMGYFAILQNISLPEGKILDYVYQMEPSAGYPVLYVRDRNEKPIKNMEEYAKAHPGHQSQEDRMKGLARMLEVRDSGSGYFEYAVFYLMAPNFYFHKWAGTDKEIVCHEIRLLEIFKTNASIPAAVMGAAKKLELAPQISLTAEKAEVKLITYTAWGGFFQETFVISRLAPHALVRHDEKCLVEYNCGIKL